MKARIISPDCDPVLTMADMSIGQVGRILGEAYKGRLVLRTYSNFVCLAEPNVTFDLKADLPIELLPVGTKIELTVE